MRITTALRIKPGMSIALIGAGGKSSTMSRIAGELRGICPAILTTSTKILDTQHTLAGRHIVVQKADELDSLHDLLTADTSIIVTGPHADDEPKWLGLPPRCLERLYEIAVKRDAVLVVEADGARGLSLKVPAEHEPVIPDWIHLVVPIVGLDIVGKRLGSESVHRPERAAALLGLNQGIGLEPKHIVEILRSPLGAMKQIPEAAAVRVLLNKAETPGRLSSGRLVAKALLTVPEIQSTLIASVHMDDPVLEVYGRIAGMILAAGSSTRLETPKQLIQWRGRPLVWHAAQAALDGGLFPLVAVTGYAEQAVQHALEGARLGFVHNPDWEEGQSTSFKAGLEAVRHKSEAVVALLSDMPFVDGELVSAIVRRHRRTLAPLVAPRAGGKRSNPVLFDAATFDELSSIEGDRGGRRLFDRYEASWVDWDEHIRFDVDTEEDVVWLQSQE